MGQRWIYGLLFTVFGIAHSLQAVTMDITASASPVQDIVISGQRITIPVVIDMSRMPEKLGSFTAEATWDAKALKFIRYLPGTAEGFTNPFVNTSQSVQGKLVFAAVNPFGAEGKVNVLNVQFTVSDSSGQLNGLSLTFKAMSSAYTFIDLLPYLNGMEATSGSRIINVPKEFDDLLSDPEPVLTGAVIKYRLSAESRVGCRIYDLQGKIIRSLKDGVQQAGDHELYWDGKDDAGSLLSTGIYLYKLQTGQSTELKLIRWQLP